MKVLYIKLLSIAKKRFFLLLSFFLFIHVVHTQGQTIPTEGEIQCFLAGTDGIFTDPGGPGGDDSTDGAPGNYPNCDCVTTTTLCSVDGSALTVDFTAYTIFASFDWMVILDTDNSLGEQFPGGTQLFNNSDGIGDGGADNYGAGAEQGLGELAELPSTSFTSTNPNGCLTFVFRASGVVDDSGWEADLSVSSGAGHPGDNLDCLTNISCLPPSGISIDDVAATSADISWAMADSAIAYIVEYGPVGFTVGTGTVINTTDLFTTLSNLLENTSYDFYLQGDCDDGEFSNYLGPFSFTTPFINPPDTCYYTLNLFDSFGDGWNGAFLTVIVNGIATDYTIPSGGDEATYEVAALANQSFIIEYTEGTFPTEVTYNIEDPSGIIIWEDGPSPMEGEVLNIFACPNCPAASNIQLVDVNANNAIVSWNVPDSAGVFMVEYGPSGFLPGSGDVVTTTETEITITGLLEDTDYDYYVTVACENGDTSGVVGPDSFHTLWLNDVGVVNILTPITACGLSTTETVSVAIQNFGQNPQSLIPFLFSVNGEAAPVNIPLDGFYTGVIGNDSVTIVEFELTWDFSEGGIYEIQAWTELDGDAVMSNDTFTYFVTSIPVVADFPYFIDFEEWDGGWDVDDTSVNSTWAFGEPNAGDIPSAASGVNAWVTNLNGNYNNNELSYILSPCFDFSGLTVDPLIRLSVNYDTETSWDGGWLEGSTDGGMTWAKVGSTTTGINWYSFTNTTQDLGDVWAGNSGGWLNAEHTLDGYGGQSDCRFRFAFDSDGSVNGFDGLGIDDVYISPPLQNDMTTLSVTNTTDSDCGDPEDMVMVEVRNAGTDDQSGFDISYQINGGDIVTENLGPITVAPGQVLPYTFTTGFDSQVFGTDFDLVAWTTLSGEQNVTNDTAFYTFTTVSPDPLPLVEDFEDSQFPAGWTSPDFTIGNGHNAGSFVIYDNVWSGDQEFQFTTSILGPINPGDSLTFDYRYTNWSAGTTATTLSGDMLEVQISNDCGESFETVFIIDENNHVPSASFTNMTVNLDDYGDQVIQIRFFATWASGDYWLDIDNINILGCPQNFGVEFTQLPETEPGAANAIVSANPAFGLPPFTYVWDNNETTQTITGLTAGTYSVTITDAQGCTDEASVEVITCPETLDATAEITGVSEAGASDGAITVTPTGGTSPYTYVWSNGELTATVNGLEEGTYTVTITDANGCSEPVDYLIDVMVATEELVEITNISLAPNPTQSSSQLDIALSKAADVRVELVSVIGQLIFQAENKNTTRESYQLDLSNYASGMYFVRIMVDQQLHVEKLVRVE